MMLKAALYFFWILL